MRGDRSKFLIIDGHSMTYRAIFKQGPVLSSPTGEPTKGTFLFCKMLFSLVQELEPSYLVMASDVPRDETFRRELYPEYKLNRDKDGPPSEDVFIQVNRIREIVDSLGVPVLTIPPFEADDIIASLVSVCASRDVECVVASRDKDLHQVVGPNCRLFDPQTHEWIDEVVVENVWGLPASKVVEIQTLAGDTTDNVPGVRGIGKRKASQLIEKFGSARAVWDGATNPTNGMQAWMRDVLIETDYDLCRRLVELRKDVPLNIDTDDIEFTGFDMKAARPIFDKLGFTQWTED